MSKLTIAFAAVAVALVFVVVAMQRDQLVPVLLGVAIVAVGLWPEPLAALSSAAARALAGASS